jgi:glycosyltransferase involved in cell wall biosynthesis
MVMISVAIPSAVNRAKFLKVGLQSIFSQTMLPDEIVISIDGQDTETLEVIHSFIDRNPKVIVKHVVNEVNIGQWANRQKSIKLTTGEFVTMLDDDDMWHPDFLEKTYNALQQNPDCGFCFGKQLLMDTNEIILKKMSEDVNVYSGRNQIPPGICNDVLQHILSYDGLPFSLSCTLFRRTVLEKIGYFPTYAPALPDLSLFLELGANRINGYFIAESIGRYRVHEGQTTSWARIPNAISRVDCLYEIYKRYGSILRKDEIALLKMWYQLAIMECAISHVHFSQRKIAFSYLSKFYRLGYGLPSFPRFVVLMALLVGVRNKSLSFFHNQTPVLKYDNE